MEGSSSAKSSTIRTEPVDEHHQVSSDIGPTNWLVDLVGCSRSKPRLARCGHDEIGSSYEPDLLFVPACFEIGRLATC
jgi:hypothetical protein